MDAEGPAGGIAFASPSRGVSAVPRLKKERPTWIRHSGVGIEFAAAVAGFALVGYWIDRHYQTDPWGLIIGAMLGLLGGTYNLIRESLAAFKRCDRDGDGPDERGKPGGS